MSDLSELIQRMYDYFQKKYGMDVNNLGPGSLFLAFEAESTTIAASDFKLQPGDSQFNAALALQTGSHLVDFVARLDSEGFILPRGELSPTVSGQYSTVLAAGATYHPQSQADNGLAAFLQLKGQAQRKFDNAKLTMNFTEFLPATFTPQFWFNDQDQTIWSQYEYSTGVSAGTAPNLPAKVVLGDWKWRVLTPEIMPKWEAASKLYAMPPAEVIRIHNLVTQPAFTPEELLTANANAVMNLHPMMLDVVPTAVNTRATNFAEVVAPVHPSVVAVAPPLPPLAQPAWKAVFIKNYVPGTLVQTLPTQNVSSSNFKLSFEYCLVNIAREWLSADLLEAGQWYLPGKSAGALAGGTYENSAKDFGFLPAKLIVIKNLSLSAQWSETDRTLVQNSASLGPVSLVASSFQDDTLSSPGMQIIGCVCEVMPMVPPVSDSSLGAPI